MATPTSTTSEPPRCTTAIPDPNGHVPPDACNANYGFYPSWEWNLVFTIAFSVTTLVHVVQMTFHRTWFCWVIVMGALWECLCFALRTLGARDQQNGNYVIISTLLFLLAPLWINAFVYMTIARLARLLLPQDRSLGVSPRWLAKLFVTADILSFGIQAAGGGMLAQSDEPDLLVTGQKVYMAGIGVQLLFVFIFAVYTCLFIRRLQREHFPSGVGWSSTRVRCIVWSMVVTIILIIIRIIFRLVEFGGGASATNPLLAHEAYQLALDALPMLIALGIMNVFHPGEVVKTTSHK